MSAPRECAPLHSLKGGAHSNKQLEIPFKHFFLHLYTFGFQVIVERNSDKKLFIVSFMYTIKVKEFILAGKILYLRFLKIFNERPSRKSAPFELAPPHELPKLNERPGRSFDQIRYTLFSRRFMILSHALVAVCLSSLLLHLHIKNFSCLRSGVDYSRFLGNYTAEELLKPF